MANSPKVWSLRARLLSWLLVATLVMGALALLDTRAEAHRTAEQLADRVLAGSAMVIAERAALSPEGALEIAIPYGALEMLSSAAQDRVFYRIDSLSKGGALVTGYGDLPIAPAQLGAPPAFIDSHYRGERVRIATLARAVSTGIDEMPFTVTMAETTLAREALSHDILLRSALRLGGMILGAMAIAWIAVTLSLRPLARLSEAISARNPGDLRPLDTPVPAEVRAPMQAVNSLLQRLDGAIGALRNFTGNAAHQLRTPMTVMRTQLALAARAPDPTAALAEAQTALTRAERVLGQLLVLARIDAAQGSLAPAPTDITALARDLTAAHIPAAAAAGVDLGFEGSPEPLPARIEPLLLSEALGNLLSNAILHAGAGCEVTLRTYRTPDSIVIVVEDNGQGISPDARTAMLARFGRANATRSGMGLGLPVVQEIAALFGGHLSLGEGPEGRGLSAQLHLPLAHERQAP